MIVASPLRDRQTAEEVAAAISAPVEYDDDLRETDFGDWEGLTFTEAQRRWPDEVAAWLATRPRRPPAARALPRSASGSRRPGNGSRPRTPGRPSWSSAT